MRLSPPITVVTIVLAALGWITVDRYLSLQRDRQSSCDAALTLLRHIDATKSKPLVVRQGSWTTIDPRVFAEGLLKNPSLRSHRDWPIYKRAADLHEISPISVCVNVRIWLKRMKIPVASNEAWEEFRLEPWRNNRSASKQAIALSMPPISPDGMRTIFDMSDSEGANNSEVRMSKADGRSWNIEAIYSMDPPE